MRLWAKGRWGRGIEIALLLVAVLALTRYFVLRHTEDLLKRQLVAQAALPPSADDRVLIFAPHPDDETLGAGGYIQQAIAAHASVHVALMTNGEYPEIDVVLFEETLHPTPEKFIRLGYMRQQESIRALASLGVPEENITFLGYPNGSLFRMWLPEHWLPTDPVTSTRTHAARSPFNNSLTPGAIHCGESMLHDVETVLERDKPTVVIALHPNDINVDHWPTYTVVRYALQELAARGESFAQHCRLYTYLIHRDHWPVPRALRPSLPLTPPQPLVKTGATDWLTLPLTAEETQRKHRAIAMYRTQGGSMDPLLLSFARANELFGEIPTLTWPANTQVPEKTIIVDPAADERGVVDDPSGDITGVTLARNGNLLTATLQLRKAPRPAEAYNLSLHGGGATAGMRTIVDYNVKKGIAGGWLVRDGARRRLDTIGLSAKESRPNHTVTLTMPWPFPNRTTFFMVRAWTTSGKRIVDETATATLTMANP